MSASGQTRKLSAILSADAAGYSKLMADDEAAIRRLLACELVKIGSYGFSATTLPSFQI